MTLSQILTPQIEKAISALFGVTIDKIEFQATRREFEGDITMVIFPLLKLVKSNPVELGNKIGTYLVENVAEVEKFNVVSGFLNIVISDSYYLDFFAKTRTEKNFGFVTPKENEKAILVEYSSPNTNKPLHLGHVRNNLLGYSVAEIIKASGKKVYKTQIINDRGIHICKSMLAWEKFGNNETPETSGMKGDKLVGKYYVEFDKAYKDQINALIQQGKSEEEAKKQAPIILEAQEMLQKWEAGDEQVMNLWRMMNQWVYTGFAETYTNLGVDFDSYYYESNTYLLGKDIIEHGLEKGVFYKKPDGSVWIDLTEDGLDEKLVLRSDGTSVYMTQDIGTAVQRSKDFPDVGGMVYTVGNEQDYHFKVLFLILKKLGYDWAQHLFHLSYGMVDLPSGKMKSREGTVVDADDLMEDMAETAKTISEELGKLDHYSEEEKAKLYKTIGLGALKYYILKVDPKKRILFNPEESVDFAGNTGPFIQYTYARIQSIIRKADFDYSENVSVVLHEKEKELLKQMEAFPEVIQNAAQNYSPALIANYTYELVREYNSFYQAVPILGSENKTEKIFRVQLSKKVADIIASAFSLLGIDVPERM
ncbi:MULTISPECIES: arginine--tRNA ligase [Flavobacterium]|jgi:arginyl-tRNA synthetase|uniref:arginine--tRNA ligase n=1 Tax=Flavobacterium TaxID=237 RepID=UPI0006FCE2AF|nr:MULTISPECIES: arginine--tRNA ligase [Flavobacterium]KQS47311.1 arginine--tRNA ligase [Flavobacterium sp. Leaf359]MBL7869684.1 arginine--tRNA ligase [Flavobacterium lindanitolerans]MDQ7960124.1 arginine--tRNA ligase [Flavobacterium lindanitolerans]OJX52280.1 MAG: arginine--tRNA ligase [Flavobacterium sp. 38-13]